MLLIFIYSSATEVYIYLADSSVFNYFFLILFNCSIFFVKYLNNTETQIMTQKQQSSPYNVLVNCIHKQTEEEKNPAKSKDGLQRYFIGYKIIYKMHVSYFTASE